MEFFERIFKLRENHTTFRREIYTGLVSLPAVSCIPAVKSVIPGTAYAGSAAGIRCRGDLLMWGLSLLFIAKYLWS